jgi:hypothetical protein
MTKLSKYGLYLISYQNSDKLCIQFLIYMNRYSTNISTITVVILALGIVGSTAVNAFLMTTTPAYAAPGKEKVIERTQSEAGYAVWEDIRVEVPGVGTVLYVELYVLESEGANDIVSVALYTEESGWLQGFTTADQNVFDANSILTSATLSPVTIEVSDTFNEFSTPIEITIEATYEGTGDLTKTKFNFHSKTGAFSAKSMGSSLSREASADLSINNVNLGTTDNAHLSAFKQIRMQVSENIIS